MGFEPIFLMRRAGDDGQASFTDTLEQAGAGVRLCTGLGGTGEGMFVSPLAIQPGLSQSRAANLDENRAAFR